MADKSFGLKQINMIGVGTPTVESSTDLVVNTNGSERVRITSTGIVGIGSDNPQAPLNVLNNNANTPTVWIQNISGGGDSPALRVQGGANNNNTVGTFEVRDYDGNVDFKVGGTGTVTIGNGNLVFPSGQGIDFSATTNGSGTTSSELLDDYEEGSWTPRISFGGSESGVTYNANEGVYTKVGRLVTCYGLIYLSSNGSATGSAAIFNLPFTSANNLLNNTALEGGGHNTYQSSCTGTIYGPMGLAVVNNNTFAYYYGATTTGGNMGNMTNSNISGTYDCRFILWYYTE